MKKSKFKESIKEEIKSVLTEGDGMLSDNEKEISQALDNLTWSRKPLGINDVDSEIDFSNLKPLESNSIKSLPVIEIDSEDMEWSENQFMSQNLGLKDQYSVLDIDGDFFLVNTEGNSYARYVIKLNNFTPGQVDEASEEEVENQKELNKELEKTKEITDDIVKEGKTKKCKNCGEILPDEAEPEDNCVYCAKPWNIEVVKEERQVYKTAEFEEINDAIKTIGENVAVFEDDSVVEEIIEMLGKLEKYVYEFGMMNVDEAKTNDEDEESLDDKEPSKKELKNISKGDSVTKLATKLSDTKAEMQQVLKKYKDSEGKEKEKHKQRLKELTKIKIELEGLL